jgi:hypothetical protein
MGQLLLRIAAITLPRSVFSRSLLMMYGNERLWTLATRFRLSLFRTAEDQEKFVFPQPG